MRLRSVCALASLLALGGCIQSVTIPAQMTSLKDACHGKDRPMAGAGDLSVWRCGEGDQAKYAVYRGDVLVKEANELEASQVAGGLSCLSRGFKAKTPEFEACAANIQQVALSATGNLRDRENAEAAARRERAADALIAAGASLQAAQPQTVNVQANCTSMRTGSMVSTTCN